MSVDARLIAANTKFSFKLFKEVLKQNSDKNIFISPSSVAIALSLTYNGARGETQENMAKTLELQRMSRHEINQANARLRVTLENLDPNVQFSIANSIWAREGIHFHPDFVQKSKNFYKAKVMELNFNDSSAASTINAWGKQSTNGKIDNIIDEVESDSILFLLNATYFKGSWTTPFSKDTTQERPFTLLDGTKKQHPLMFQSGNYKYHESEKFQAISLPYGEERLSMYIFLPNQGVSLQEFYESLSAENWESWMKQLSYQEGSIGLPRFKFEYDIVLNDVLKSLGMGIAFDAGKANFSGMQQTPSPLYIDEVKHKTFVEVNEEGTEAAAATSVVMEKEFVVPFDMVADRPFFCTIQDNQTGTILFIGSIVEPM
jgi:serpin B